MWGQQCPLGVSEIPRVEGQMVLQIVQKLRVAIRRGYRRPAPRTPKPINNISEAAFNGTSTRPRDGKGSSAISQRPSRSSPGMHPRGPAWLAVINRCPALPPREAIPKARAAAIRALELDETLAEAHASLGVIKAYDWDGPRAEKEFKRAIELNPNLLVSP